jgi:hypothetical protein
MAQDQMVALVLLSVIGAILLKLSVLFGRGLLLPVFRERWGLGIAQFGCKSVNLLSLSCPSCGEKGKTCLFESLWISGTANWPAI